MKADHPLWTANRWAAIAASVTSGLAVCAGLPPWGWWPLSVAGLALWLALLAGAAPRQRFWRSFGVGVGWFAPSLLWMVTFTPPGYVIAVGTFAALLGAAGLATPRGPMRWLALPAALAISELIREHAPFGGVPLSPLSLTQAQGPLAPVARLGGAALLTLAVAVAAAALEASLRRRPRASAALMAPVVLLAAVGVVAPRGSVVAPLTVAVVQGGGPQGTVALDTDPADVFNRHLEASAQIPGGGAVDLVLWPENVVDVNGRLADSTTNDVLAAEAQRLGAPLVVGVVEDVDAEHFANFSVVYDADGVRGDRYDKERRVPFGEYVPFRPLVEPFGGGLLPRRDQVPGDGVAMVRLPLADGQQARAAVVVSWEVFFPRRVREGVNAGGELVLNPTNGASYWLTLVQSQQVANSRLRAIESGRWVLQSAPTGFSAVVDPSGNVLARSAVSEQRVLRATVERRTGTTVAQATGLTLPLVVAIALLAAAWAPTVRKRRRRERPTES
ncbi:MAG: apolipoprotein N-acyltransferase [Microthrixaceae bacterium]